MRFSDLVKGGPYIGPRGGKWADPQHKIPWQEEKKRSLLGILRDFKFRPKKDKPNTKSRGMLRGLLTKDFGLLISKSSSLSTLMKFRGIFAAHVNEDVRTPKERKQGTTEPAKRTRDGYQNRNKTKTELTPKQMLALIDRRIAFLEGKKKEQEADKAPVAVDMTTGKVSTPDAQEKPDSDHLHEREDVPEGFPLDKSALEVLGKLAATSDKEKRREISFEFPAVVDALESAALVIFTSVKGWLISDKGREFVDEVAESESESEDNFETMPESVSDAKSRYESREYSPRPSTQEILKQEGLSLAAATALFRYVASDQDELPDGPYGTKMTLKLVEQGFLEQGSVRSAIGNQVGRETFFKITDKGRKVAVDVRRNAIESAFEMAEDLKLKDKPLRDAYKLVLNIVRRRKGSSVGLRNLASVGERRLGEIANVLSDMLITDDSPRSKQRLEERVEKLLADVQDKIPLAPGEKTPRQKANLQRRENHNAKIEEHKDKADKARSSEEKQAHLSAAKAHEIARIGIHERGGIYYEQRAARADKASEDANNFDTMPDAEPSAPVAESEDNFDTMPDAETVPELEDPPAEETSPVARAVEPADVATAEPQVPQREILDAGEHVYGSRADEAEAFKAMGGKYAHGTGDNIDYTGTFTKQSLFKRPKMEADREAGVTAGGHAIKVAIYNLISKSPFGGRSDGWKRMVAKMADAGPVEITRLAEKTVFSDAKKVALNKAFHKSCVYIDKALRNVRTYEDGITLIQELKDYTNATITSEMYTDFDKQRESSWDAAAKIKKDNPGFNPEDVYKTTRFEGGERAGYTFTFRDNERKKEALRLVSPLGEAVVNLTKNKTTTGFRTKLREAKILEEKGWGSVDEQIEIKKKAREDVFKLSRARTDVLERVGGVQVGEADSKDFLETCGLRNVQFGKNMAHNAREQHLGWAYSSMLDLADMLNIAPDKMGLGHLTDKPLAIGLGARGVGARGFKEGAAAAHYEPDSKIINLTNMSGGGSLAHEWGHFLDNIVASKLGTNGEFLSTSSNVSNPKIKEAILNVMHAIQGKGTVDANAEVKRLLVEKRKAKEQFESVKKKYEEERKTYSPSELSSVYVEKVLPARSAFSAADNKYKDALKKAANGDFGSTQFYRDAVMFETGTPYWSSSEEMFARAFETYIQDTLASKNRKNTYLVQGTDRPLATGIPSKADPNDVKQKQDALKEKMQPEITELENVRKNAFMEYYALVEKIIERDPKAKKNRRGVYSDARREKAKQSPEARAKLREYQELKKPILEKKSKLASLLAAEEIDYTRQAQPYPHGEERNKIVETMDQLVKVLFTTEMGKSLIWGNSLTKGMKSLQERDLAILIPPPPSEMQRVAELSKVSDQYRNRKCPEQMQDVLDSDMDSLFNALLMDAGLPSSMYMITGISRSIVAPIKIHKEYYGTMRPNVLAARHGVDFEYDHLESAQTPSYPSGHTTQAAYLAKVLGSIYPEIQSKLDKLASQIAESRIDRGVHLPSDNEAGRQLAQALFEKTNKQMRTGDVRYQEVFGG